MQGLDIARRQAVMTRSQKLGHCICNPAHACPCPPLLDFNVCPCAGERPPRKKGDAALTRHVRKAGCASKIGQADLLQILRNLLVKAASSPFSSEVRAGRAVSSKTLRSNTDLPHVRHLYPRGFHVERERADLSPAQPRGLDQSCRQALSGW